MYKKLIILALALLFVGMTSGAFAATNVFDVKGWTIDADGVMIPKTSNSGLKVAYEEYTSANTAHQLVTADSGKVICDTGGASGPTETASCSKHTLPSASVGLTFTLTTGAQCYVTLDTSSTDDTILFSAGDTGLDAGDSLKSPGQAGDSITVTAISSTEWAITEMSSTTWTDNSTN